MYFQGRPLLGSLQVVGVFKEMVRRHHVLFSIFCAHEDAQVVLTLTQRVTVGDIAAGYLVYVTMCSKGLPYTHSQAPSCHAVCRCLPA